MRERITPAYRLYVRILLGVYAVFWLWLAIAPVYRKDWALENVLVPYRVDENIELLRRCAQLAILYQSRINVDQAYCLRAGVGFSAGDPDQEWNGICTNHTQDGYFFAIIHKCLVNYECS